MAARRLQSLAVSPWPSRLQRAWRLVLLAVPSFAAACAVWLAPVGYFYWVTEQAHDVRSAARSMRLHELEARRAEKDFLLRSVRNADFLVAGSSPYLLRHTEMLQAMRQDIERLELLLAEPGRSRARALRQSVDAYGSSFAELVGLLRRAAGAESALRAAWSRQLEGVAVGHIDASPSALARAALWVESWLVRVPGFEHDAQQPSAVSAPGLPRCVPEEEPRDNLLLQEPTIQKTILEMPELRLHIGVDRTRGKQGELRSAIHAVEPILDDIIAEVESAADHADELLLGGLVAACAGMGALLTWALLLGRSARSRAQELAQANRELERGMAARELAERELKSLLECAPEALLLIDESHSIVLGNAQAARLFGCRMQDLEKQGIDTFVRGLDPAALIASGSELRVEGVRRTGPRLPLEVSWSRFETSGSSYTFLALRDLTSHLSMLADLERKHEQVLQSARLAAIGQMAAGLAHESGNALQRSQACLDRLARRVAHVPETADLVARIQDAQDHLQRLHSEVRDYAAPIRLQLQECDPGEIVDRAWESLALTREGCQARFEQHSPGPLRCAVDAFALEQVFRNLLRNALEAAIAEARITITWSHEERDGLPWLRAAVQDCGRGLTEAERARLFEPFFTTKTRGTGLGLSIARRLVEAHGGSIELGDTIGPGTNIVVRLPCDRRSS